MVAGVLPFANGLLHRVRRWRWGHWRFSRSCRGCRSYLRQQALLAVGGHCLHGLRDWREWWGEEYGELLAGFTPELVTELPWEGGSSF